MDKGRFSLLLLDPGEIYFEDFSVLYIPPDTTRKNYDSKVQEGRLKMCSKSLVFDPKDITKAIIKLPLKECIIIEQWKGEAKFISTRNVLYVNCKEYIEMLEGNAIAPYKFKELSNFLFLLNYANISDCLHQISQLCRAATLPNIEQSNMIATIVHSRHSRVTFDPLWLDLYEKVIMEIAGADRVSPLIMNPGRILLSTMRLYYQPYNNIEMSPVIKINLKDIKRIVRRRFLLRHIGLEIYLTENSITNSHYYFSFKSQQERDTLYNRMLEQSELKLPQIEQDVITLQWQNGVISNYEYLCYINSLGDRTLNDLTQYPVFPWVISNYTSQHLDLENPENFRDLSKPIGALNLDRLKRLLERYNDMPEPKFIYGSHYSTPGFVLYYLARMYPNYVLCLQGGRFDHPDRMFNSVADAFKNCFNNMSDFKELIPEFYDVSQKGKFLENNMGINFGHRHNGKKVDNVELPPWANSSEHFINTLREALESDIVSKSLHHWIDLIFGYKQKGQEAVNASNVFYHLCYEGNVDLDNIKDRNKKHALEIQIMEFGQIPKQVFKVPHPERKIGPPLITAPSQIEPLETDFEECRKYNITELDLLTTFNTHRGTVSHLFINKNNQEVTSVGHDSKLKVFSLVQNKQSRSASIGNMPLSSCTQLPHVNVLAIGSWDNQIVLYDLDYGKVVDEIVAHEDTITCMCFGQIKHYLVSGSGDCTVKIWKGIDSESSLVHCLYRQIDHNSQVTCLDFDPQNNFLAVATKDGKIYFWETKNFTLHKQYDVFPSKINALSYSLDGKKLALGGEDKVFKVLDVDTGMSVFNKTLNSVICCVNWREYLLAIGCDNGVLYLWDMFEVRMLVEVQAHSESIKTVDISYDKSIVATGSEDKLIKVWKPKKS